MKLKQVAHDEKGLIKIENPGFRASGTKPNGGSG